MESKRLFLCVCIGLTLSMSFGRQGSTEGFFDEDPFQDSLEENWDDDTVSGPPPDRMVPALVEGARWATPGQAAGITATDKTVFVMHRAERIWDMRTFDSNNNFVDKSAGPIKDNVIVGYDHNGKKVKAFGSSIFYLPHGLTVDHKGNFWATDVGTHEVYELNHEGKVLRTFGENLKPGKDLKHFCKPTDVAVAKNGDFFVSDGYCNSRVLKFLANGTVVAEIGKQDNLVIPHSVALLEKKDLICVADRENLRIVCYNAGLNDPKETGKRMMEITDDTMGRVFGIAYSSLDNLLYAVTGDTPGLENSGFTVEMDTGSIVDIWGPDQGFENPHDVTVTPKGDQVFVAEIGPNQITQLKYEDDA